MQSKNQRKYIMKELQKLKKQLKSIKSIKSISLVQPSILKNKQKISKNSLITKQNYNQQSLLKNKIRKNQSFDFKSTSKKFNQQIQQQRRALGQQLNMSSCKKLKRSKSHSKDKSNNSKSNMTSKSKSKSKKQKQLNKLNTKITLIRSPQPKQFPQFDEIYLNTISQKNKQNRNGYNVQQTKKNSTLLRIQSGLNQFSFNDNITNSKIQIPTKQNTKTKQQVFQLQFQQLNHRVKVSNYDFEFERINLYNLILTSSKINQKQQKKIRSFQRSFDMKNQLILNQLKKSLFKYPNFSVFIKKNLRKSKQNFFISEIQSQSQKQLQKQYKQYVKNIQLTLNKLTNFINKQINEIKSYNLTQLANELLKRQQKQNQKDHQNINEQKLLSLQKQIKKYKKMNEKLQSLMQEKDEYIKSIEYKYVVKIQQEQNYQTTQSLITLIQQQNKQLKEKVNILLNKLDQHQLIQQQLKQKNKQLTKQLSHIQQKYVLLQQDLTINKIKQQQYKQTIKAIDEKLKLQSNKSSKFSQQIQTLKLQFDNQTISHQRQVEQLFIKNKNLVDEVRLLKQKQDLLYKRQQQQRSNNIKTLSDLNIAQKQNQNLKKTLVNLKIKIQQLIKDNFNLQQQSTTSHNIISQYEYKTSQLSNELKTKQTIINRLSIVQNQYQKIKTINNQLESQISQMGLNIELLTKENQQRYEEISRLNQSIANYKDRYIKAQIELRQNKYLQQRQINNQIKQHNNHSNYLEIKSIIKDHQSKSN